MLLLIDPHDFTHILPFLSVLVRVLLVQCLVILSWSFLLSCQIRAFVEDHFKPPGEEFEDWDPSDWTEE